VIQYLVGAISVVLMFLVLIGPHEGGHFAFAKLFKVRVYEFAIGMGTRLLSTTRGGTLYALRAIPIGGFVRLGGMEPENYDEPNGFHQKAAYQRILILLGGPAVNFLVAAVVMSGIFMTQLNSDPGKIAGVQTNRPAYAAGIRPGDSVLSVNGHAVTRPEDIRAQVNSQPGQPAAFRIRHPDGTESTITLTPVYEDQEKRYVVGIFSQPIVSPVTAVVEGFKWPFEATAMIATGLYQLATGQIPGGFFGPEGATGAIGIAAITYSAAEAGLIYWFQVAAALSVALGLANLLPLPALDGGRIVVVLLEALRRRPFDRDKELAVQRWGLAAILALAGLIAYFDIQRIVTHQFPGLR
jgi:regulator of sigma E protease